MKKPVWKCPLCIKEWGEYSNLQLGWKWCPDCIAWDDDYTTAKSIAWLLKKGLIKKN